MVRWIFILSVFFICMVSFWDYWEESMGYKNLWFFIISLKYNFVFWKPLTGVYFIQQVNYKNGTCFCLISFSIFQQYECML